MKARFNHNILNPSWRQYPNMSKITKIQEIWSDVYNPTLDTRNTIRKHFHPQYTQCINGVTMDREQYIEHVLAQKKNMVIEKFVYAHYLEKDNRVFVLYYPKGRDIHHQPMEAEVIAYFEFQGDQLLKIHGQVRLLEGMAQMVDMD